MHVLVYNRTLVFSTVATFFIIALSPPTATIHPMLPTEEGALFEFPHPCPPPPLFMFCYVPSFLRGVFLVFLEKLGESESRTVAVVGLQSPLRHCIWYWVCTNKPDLTCLQLHHSSEACVCLNQSGSLYMLSISPSRHVPMICYYLFPSLLTKKVTWHLAWGFNRHVSWRTRKMAFTVIEFSGALIFASCVLFWLWYRQKCWRTTGLPVRNPSEG